MIDPNWVSIARRYVGLREVPGPNSNSTIMGWAKKLGIKILGAAYGSDAVPWCGLAMAYVMNEAGFIPPRIALRASSWDTWGQALGAPRFGCVVRFQRPGGGHVGLIVGEGHPSVRGVPTHCFRVLGGNQSDMVSETWIEAARAVAYRWPPGVPLPAAIPLPRLTATGAPSTDEA